MAAQVLTYFTDFNTNAHGQIDITGILDIKDYRQVDIEILQSTTSVAMTVVVMMGKIAGTTLAATVGSFPLSSSGAKITTYSVVGPEMKLYLTGGPANTRVSIQAWVFLH